MYDTKEEYLENIRTQILIRTLIVIIASMVFSLMFYFITGDLTIVMILIPFFVIYTLCHIKDYNRIKNDIHEIKSE